MLEAYNRVAPRGADRILTMAETQAKHRHSLEAAVVNGNVAAEKRGQIFAFLLGLVAIIGGIVLIAFNKNAEGLTSIITAFTALAGIFVYGRWQQRQEREQKRREMKEAEQQQRLPLSD